MCGISHQTREIRTPSIGLRINNILRDFPVISREDAEKLFGSICVKAVVTKAKGKTIRSFHDHVSHIEMWADGFAAAGGGELLIVSGQFSIMTTGSAWPRVVIFVVRDTEQFVQELRQLVQVAAVQLA